MKRIVITRSNPIEPDSRVEKEANSLAKAGHTVTLIAWDRTDNYGIKIDEKELNDCSVKRISFGAKAKYGAGFKSLVPFAKFQFKLFSWLIINRNNYDIGHFCDFDTAFTGSIAATLTNKKYVFDLFDYMSTNADTAFRKVIKKCEDSIINKSTATIICTEKRKDQIKDSKPKKLVVIHNTPDMIEHGTIKIKGSKGKTKIVYVGILQQKQRMLKELVSVIAAMPDVELHVGGFGELEEFMRDSEQRYDNVFFYGKMKYKDTLALEEQSDLMTAIYNPIIGNSLYAAPNKFYEALMLGKPLVMVKGTGMSDYVEEYNIGEIIECTEDSLRDGITSLVSNRKKWLEMAQRMKALYEEQFSWEKMEKRLVSLYEEL